MPRRREWLTHSSIVWRIPWAEEPGGLQGSQRVEHDWSNGWPFFICTLSLGSQTGGDFEHPSPPRPLPSGPLAMPGDILVVPAGGWKEGESGYYWYLVNRDKGVAKHPTVSRAALHNKKWSSSECVYCQETLVLAEQVQETPVQENQACPPAWCSSQAVVMFPVVLGSEWKVLN